MKLVERVKSLFSREIDQELIFEITPISKIGTLTLDISAFRINCKYNKPHNLFNDGVNGHIAFKDLGLTKHVMQLLGYVGKISFFKLDACSEITSALVNRKDLNIVINDAFGKPIKVSIVFKRPTFDEIAPCPWNAAMSNMILPNLINRDKK